VRALRGWAVPLVLPIAQAWKTAKKGAPSDGRLNEQLHALGKEVARTSCQFALQILMPPKRKLKLRGERSRG